MISGLNRTAFDLAVYASQGWLPTHHARLASGCWSGSTGRDWLPAGFHLKGFKLPTILLSRASWARSDRFEASKPRGHEASRSLRSLGPGRPGWSPTQPGSRGALLLPSPLRTTRKPFGLCRSSLSQGPSRNPVGHASPPPARYWSGADARSTPEAAPAVSCCHLLCLPSQLFRRSRAETPEGSQPAFA